jgi:hypothetical protein
MRVVSDATVSNRNQIDKVTDPQLGKAASRVVAFSTMDEGRFKVVLNDLHLQP